MNVFPTGTVTFLFTDIEDSTRLWEQFPEAMRIALTRHDALVRSNIERHGGAVVKSTGDGFLAAFAHAEDGLVAALEAARALSAEHWDPLIGQLRARMALHTGTAQLRDGDYYGSAVNRTARLEAAAHGGQILLSQATRDLVRDSLPDDIRLLDRGQHRLKGLSRPERTYQLLAPGLPVVERPLRTVDAPIGGGLADKLTSFVGRERELAEVKELLRTARLVTLTGPGGTGKTRLSLQVADATDGRYVDGVHFVALASTTDPALVASAIAHEVGVIEQPDQPLVELLGRYFSDKQVLLVLDNFEHVLAAVPLVSELLAAAPRLVVLTTSRETLRLDGEHEYPVPPLAIPAEIENFSASELSVYESVSLFVQRARAASPTFRLTEDNAAAVAAICVRLDGLPLAIELAAARVKIFSPQQLRDRLADRLRLLKGGARDLPARQRTLRDSIDWSYNLLDQSEQQLFGRLAVFTGGRSLDAIEAVCGPGLPVDPWDGLESLLNKSLIYQSDGPGGEPRFVMLETIQAYADERLAESGEERQIRDRHLDYFLSLAEEMEPGYRRHGQLLLLARTEAEVGNLRAALGWALDSDQIEAAARLVSAVDYFLRYQDRLVEGYQWFKRVLTSLQDIPPRHRVRFLLGANRLAWVNHDFSRCSRFVEQGLVLARELGDRHNEAWFLVEGIGGFEEPEKFRQEIERCERGLGLFQELGDKPGIAAALNILGELARATGDLDRARETYEGSLVICRESGEILRELMNMGNLAAVEYLEGNYARSRDLVVLATRQMLEISWKQGTIDGLWGLAGPLAKLGEPEKAARLLGAATGLWEKMGIAPHPSDLPEIDRYSADVRALLDQESFESAWAEGNTMTLEQAVSYALEEGQTSSS